MTYRFWPSWGSSLFAFFFIVMMVITMGCGFLAGCDDFETQAYKGLRVSATVYDTSMRTAADLLADRRITDVQFDAIAKAGSTFRLAYLSACGLLEVYHSTHKAVDKKEFTAAVAQYSIALTEIVTLLNQYKPAQSSQGSNNNPEGISRADPGDNHMMVA